jgi:hypothetical protein
MKEFCLITTLAEDLPTTEADDSSEHVPEEEVSSNEAVKLF